jgi:hypothetical protein
MKSSKKLLHGNFRATHPSHHREWATLRNEYTDLLAPKGNARMEKILGVFEEGS